MNMKNILLVLLLVSISFAGLTVPSTSVSAESFKPGSNGIITIVVENPATSQEFISSVDMDIDPPPEIVMSGEHYIGDLEPGGSTLISLPFIVADDASSAVYSINIELTGIADKPTGGYDVFTRRLSVPVTVVDAPLFSMSADRQTLTGIDEISLTVSNNGGPATNLRLSIPETSSVALYGTDELYIGDASEAVTVSLLLDSRDAPEGAIDVPFSLEYENEIGISETKTTKLRMTVKSEQLDLVVSQKSDIYTRGDATLTLEVRNDGDEALEDVKLSFSDSSIKLKEDDEYDFGDLNPGEGSTVSLMVFTDMSPGVHLIPTTVEWVEKDLQKSESKMVPITITSDADVAVFLEAKPLPLTRNSEHTVSVLISNLGSYGIENVDVSISSPALRSIDISDRQYIGGLQRDDFSTVQFLMEVNATEPGSYPVYLSINYRDQSGEWKQKDIVKTITVYDGMVEEESPVPYAVGLAVLAVLVWYFKFRKKGPK